jgi:glutamine synthetase
MEIMQNVAKRNGLVCLLHEKPFRGVNGSGKHNNWSISTNTGINLFAPGDTPHDNAQFLLFLCAVIKAVDEHQDLLRISVASAGNDRRLGANEAPPAVISIFLGDELTAVLDSIENDTAYDAKEKTQIKLGVHVIPRFPRDTTDRNRTSPFAFTGNKFEFRMVGSADSIACANMMINTAMADTLCAFADELEKTPDFNAGLQNLIKKTYREHKRIVFNGNGYDEAWLKEASGRGLQNLRATPDCLPYYYRPENIALFARNRVLSEAEIKSRAEIILENYCKVINIEARTMGGMVTRGILPAVSRYCGKISETVNAIKGVNASSNLPYELGTIETLNSLKAEIYALNERLSEVLAKTKSIQSVTERSMAFKNDVIPLMDALRTAVDGAESVTSNEYWPYPGYSELLFGVI